MLVKVNEHFPLETLTINRAASKKSQIITQFRLWKSQILDHSLVSPSDIKYMDMSLFPG